MNILVLTPSVTDTCSFYRSGGIIADIEKKTDWRFTFRQPDQMVLHWAILLRYDLVMLQRPFDGSMVQLMQYLKEMGKPVWVDYDDNLLAVPEENPKYELYNPQVRENIKLMLRMADAVSVTTEELKRVCSEYNNNVWVIPNAFNDYLFRQTELKQARSRVVLWRGSDTHVRDLMGVITEVNMLSAEYPEWQFLFMGFYPWYIDTRGRNNVFKANATDVVRYFHNGRRMSPTVLYSPLADNLFNRCKSNTAWIEGSYFGAVVVAPDWEEWRRPGVITYKDPQEFYMIMRNVITGKLNLGLMNQEGWGYVMDNLRLSKVNVKRMELIKSLV